MLGILAVAFVIYNPLLCLGLLAWFAYHIGYPVVASVAICGVLWFISLPLQLMIRR